MTYIPIVVPTPQPLSPRARELADQLAEVLIAYEQAHPALTRDEVKQATQLAVQKTRTGTPMAGPILAVGLGILAFAGLIAFYFVGRGGSLAGATSVGSIGIIALFVLVAALVAVLRRAP